MSPFVEKYRSCRGRCSVRDYSQEAFPCEKRSIQFRRSPVIAARNERGTRGRWVIPDQRGGVASTCAHTSCSCPVRTMILATPCVGSVGPVFFIAYSPTPMLPTSPPVRSYRTSVPSARMLSESGHWVLDATSLPSCFHGCIGIIM